MRRSVAMVVFAVLLAVGGAVCLIAGKFERRMAIAQEDAAVLDFADPGQEYAASNSFVLKAELGKGSAEHE